jgi:1-hydroxycarotenoid 3,4-desaturase
MQHDVIVIGAGVAGLTAALELAHHGMRVDVFERAASPGGKLSREFIDGASVDVGPTVFTMRWVFDELFDLVGSRFDSAVRLHKARTLARHQWPDGSVLDLHADTHEAADAIARFSGQSEADRFLAFCDRSEEVFRSLDPTFLRAPRPTPYELTRRFGWRGLPRLWRISPFLSLSARLGKSFTDPRLRQLFGRYATYCGASPYLAPATLMLIAHVEREGVYLLDDGMFSLVHALEQLARDRGVQFHYNTPVVRVEAHDGTARGVMLTDGTRLPARAVVVNADPAALASGQFGSAAQAALPRSSGLPRSLSAMTWAAVAVTGGLPLLRHTVFFSSDYAAEFNDLFVHRRVPREPTVYICAQDRNDRDGIAIDAPERLLCLVNAPANADPGRYSNQDIALCTTQLFEGLRRRGLKVLWDAERMKVTTPNDFAQRFPATNGALYGMASHGWTATFRRPGSRTRLQRLYLAGGATHPGPGVPMAALSGRLAAASVLSDLASTQTSLATGTRGGTSTPSAMINGTR